jgi:hypothetical protein
MAQADEAGVLTERYIQTPVQAVLNLPVRAHYMQEGGYRRKAN